MPAVVHIPAGFLFETVRKDLPDRLLPEVVPGNHPFLVDFVFSKHIPPYAIWNCRSGSYYDE
jgi:hypothetical protein